MIDQVEARWASAWRLLTLDLTQPHLSLVAFPLGDLHGLQLVLRQRSAQSTTFDPRVHGTEHFAALRWVREHHGDGGLCAIRTWVDYVYDGGNAGRRHEFEWAMLAIRINRARVDDIQDWMSTFFDALAKSIDAVDTYLDRWADQVVAEPLTAWDVQQLTYYGSSKEEIVREIRQIAEANAFLVAWSAGIAELSDDQLRELVLFGRSRARDVEVNLGAADTLPFYTTMLADLVRRIAPTWRAVDGDTAAAI